MIDDAQTSTKSEWLSIDASTPVRQGLVGRDAVYRLVRQGRIRCLRLSARRLLIRDNFLEELVEKGESV